MVEANLDFRETLVRTPDKIRQQYIDVVPQFLATHPEFSPQEALDHIRETERESRSFLFQSTLSPEATEGQAMVFWRKKLKLKEKLGLLSESDTQELDSLNNSFGQLASTLVEAKGLDPEKADELVMNVSRFAGVQTPQEAIGILLNGPKIEGFEEDEVFRMPNEAIQNFLQSMFGQELLFGGRVMQIQKLTGLPVRCHDVGYGNSFISKGARWDGSFLVLPTLEMYEEVEKELEKEDDVDNLDHRYKLRASTASGSGFSTIKVYEFAVEQPSHFDYLAEMEGSDSEKMQAYFLGIVAHEVVHALVAYYLSPEDFENFQHIAFSEQNSELPHKFATAYVDRHKNIFASTETQIAAEDLPESVRIYLTNADFLKIHFPLRYEFIKQQFPDLQENAILKFVTPTNSRKTEPIE